MLRGGPRIWLAGGRQVRNLVFVDDVVGGLLAAEERGGVGEEYLLGGEEVSPRELERGRCGGAASPCPCRPARRWRIAGILTGCAATTSERGYATAVRNLLREWRFSSGKARRDLGYQPLPLAEGLARTIDWLRFMKG